MVQEHMESAKASGGSPHLFGAKITGGGSGGTVGGHLSLISLSLSLYLYIPLSISLTHSIYIYLSLDEMAIVS